MDLNFDKMTVDTSLAQQYVDKFKQELQKIENETLAYDGKEFKAVTENYPQQVDIQGKLRHLASSINKNMELFAQLDYQHRKIPIEDTRAQIKLIVKQLNYTATKQDLNKIDEQSNSTVAITMSSETPLLLLGYLGKVALLNRNCLILAEQQTKAICCLFTQLCYEERLAVRTAFTNEQLIKQFNSFIKHDDLPKGAIGVITQNADVDSAVDLFLASSVQAPWSLRRILVQESVYQQFKDALMWKCNLDKAKQNSGDSTTIEYSGQQFVLDPVGTSGPQQAEVHVESYRTTKEVLALLNQYNLPYLSLWTANISEFNEIAHTVRSPLVWANSFNDFRGPNKISEALYSHIGFIFCNEPMKNFKPEGELSKLQQSWLELDLDTRREILCNILESFHFTAENVPSGRDNIQLRHQLMAADSRSLVDIGKDYICMVTSQPYPITYLLYDRLDESRVAQFFEALLRGNAFVVDNQHEPEYTMVDTLNIAGVPVVHKCYYKGIYYSNFNLHPFHISKTIWMNSGTIFAN